MNLVQYSYICLRSHTLCHIEKLCPKNLTQYSYICLGPSTLCNWLNFVTNTSKIPTSGRLNEERNVPLLKLKLKNNILRYPLILLDDGLSQAQIF